MASSVPALVAFVGVGLSNGVSAAGTVTPAPSGGATTALVWPGGGRMLSAPLVVGGSVLGAGSLEMVGDTITSNTANFDQSPPELSLRLFTMVPNKGGGFSAILRFRVPVVVLHSWRGHAVRQTMTVIVTPPSGSAQAVQLQADGTAMTGTVGSGRFSPSAPGQAVITGNVVVFGIPASLGTAPDWTVQAIVKVQADEPLHPNRPATGYAAGTSIVPIGMLTTAGGGSDKWGVADAVTALTTVSAGGAGTQGLRPTAVRVEAAGAARTAVVTLDGSPLQVAPADNPHLDLDIARAGFGTLDHPLRITWLPNGDQPVTSARVAIDAIAIGDVPVSVSGNEVRFGLGGFVPRSSVAKPPTPRLDTMQYRVTVPIGRDEAVRSADGISGPPISPDSADINVSGKNVTVTLASSRAAAQGRIDSAGRFTAVTDTDCYTGSVDAVGNVVIYRTTTNVAGALSQRAARRIPQHEFGLNINNDLTIADPGPIYPRTRVLTYYKAKQGTYEPIFETPPPSPAPGSQFPDNPAAQDDFSFSSPASGPGQPSGAQAGNPDWPNSPTVSATAAGGNAAAFAVRVSGGKVPSGRPIDATTPWVLPSMLAGPPTGAAAAGAASNAASGGSWALPIGIAVAAVAIIAGGAVLLMRRRRTAHSG